MWVPLLDDLFPGLLGKDVLQSTNEVNEVVALFMEWQILISQVGLDSVEKQESVRGSIRILVCTCNNNQSGC